MIEDEKIDQMIGITNCSKQNAVQYLEMAGGNLQEAIALYMDLNPGSNQAPQAAAASTYPNDMLARDEMLARSLEADEEASDVRAPIASFQDTLLAQQPQMPYYAPVAPIAPSISPKVENEVSPGDRAFATMFGPPTHLLFHGSLDDARLKASKDNKWLLVNIQKEDEFASHTLNRDVWNDDLIKGVVESNFIFWQKAHSSPEGSIYINRYKPSADLPHIGVIDPRTGRLVKSWTSKTLGTQGANASGAISGFLDTLGPTPGGAASNPTGSGGGVSSFSGFFNAAKTGSPVSRPETAVVALPDEPPEDTEGVLKVLFRYPDGTRAPRRLLPTDTVATLYLIAQSQSKSKDAFNEKKILRLEAFHPPKNLEVEYTKETVLSNIGINNELIRVSFV
eukprot:Platyproteum_vivax@DN6300_c0_g1_i1.p1